LTRWPGQQEIDVNETKKSGSPALISVEPWPTPVTGSGLIGELRDAVLKYIVVSREEATAIALFVLHAHAHDSFRVSPILAALSPVKRCGKTTLLSLLKLLLPKALAAANLSSAVVYRSIERYHPTLLIDEAETFLGENREMIGILNSGHTRATAFVARSAADNFEPQMFSTWAPEVIAKIGFLPETLEDRSIVILLRRKLKGEEVSRIRQSDEERLRGLRARAVRWAADTADVLADADPHVPTELHDRAADNWSPLLAIADTVGGEWPEEARRVARWFARRKQADVGLPVKLLEDVRALLTHAVRDGFISSEALAKHLRALSDSPWRDTSDGRGLSTARLGHLLSPFGIRSRQVNNATTANRGVRGYQREDFADAFHRYLSPPEEA
jgi:putative DNA primase/helicase